MMSELQIQKIEETLRRSVAALDTKSLEEREAGYIRLRLAVDSLLKKPELSLGPEVGSMLRDSLEEMIQTRRSGEEAQNGEVLGVGLVTPAYPASDGAQAARPGRHGFTLGTLVGLVFAGALGAGLAWSGALSAFDKVPGSSAVAAAYEENVPLIEIAEAFLERVREEVIGRQAKDPDGLTQVAGEKFVPLKTMAPELAGELPKPLRNGSNVIVRADATGYKILFNWPLCATVQFAKPQLLDPVRKNGVLGCIHFGVWNETGAEW
ncbi:hypothetical protein [Mesorhizobium sp. KR1-2]|uniref:hypothetical protein n=1 Tax=Mesorhizobium sp. KR1-2 TaxID=3156609 RepID=UPI0032B38C18